MVGLAHRNLGGGIVLGPLDDTLLHQAPTTFDHAVTGDHRFFDRWAVGVQHHELSAVYGLAVYKNTNTCDGFFCAQRGDRQFNMRLSRPLRPHVDDMSVGPLRIALLDPLREHRLIVAATPHSPLSAELVWRGNLPAREESPHFARRGGRIVQDYIRYDQLGTASGWVAIGEDRVEVDGWFAWRDHSWGVRPGMGGTDPVSAQPSADTADAESGSLFIWMAFRAGTVAGQFQTVERSPGGRQSIDGHLIADVAQPEQLLRVVDIRHDISFVLGHTVCARAQLSVTTEDGRRWEFDASPLRAPWAFSGSGYSGGFNDERGLGVPRGELIESDGYDLSHPADVVMADGTRRQPWHRETDVRIRLDGAVDGDAHLTVIARPPIPVATLGAV